MWAGDVDQSFAVLSGSVLKFQLFRRMLCMPPREEPALALSNRLMQEDSETKWDSWSQPLKGWRWWGAMALLFSCLAIVTRLVLALSDYNPSRPGAISPWILSVGLALAAALLLGILARCLSGRQDFKRALIGLAGVAGMIALFYAEEGIRGRLAWSRFKTHWEGKGEKFDFAAFIPPAVPADQNFATAPVVVTTYGQILDENGHRISPYNTNVINRLQMPIEVGSGGPTNGIGNWQKAVPFRATWKPGSSITGNWH